MKPRGKFVPFTEMAEKWDYSEDELIQLAIQMEEFNLYCLKPTPGNPSRMPFFIGDELGDFLPGKSTISCSKFGYKTSDYEEGTFVSIGPGDLLTAAALYRAGHPESNHLESVIVDRTDLYLHRDEIVDMETKHPELVSAKFNSNSLEQKRAEQSNTSKASPGISANSESVNMLLNNDVSDSTSHSSIGLETAATLDKQLSLPGEIDKKSHSMAQAENPDGIKKPHKKNVKADKLTVKAVSEVSDTIPSIDDENEQQSSGIQAAPDEIYLTLYDIIGNKKKGIHGIIPMSKTKWYDGIKAGIFPDQNRLGLRSVVWKKSDILALLKRMEKGELGVGIKV